MRIIAGIAKGMTLAAPRGDARPTSDRVREAIFSSLGERVIGAMVLDLFAGSGALGLEAASRGASAVTFVENARASLDALERNVSTFRRGRDVTCEFRVLRADAFRLPALEGMFSLIFADPPYGDAAQKLLATPLPLAPGGALVLESAKRETLTPGETWSVKREAIYGDTRVSFLVTSSPGPVSSAQP
jgi:16S rRNA (guanine(966)-N(2))-methyltransferase RsmD